MSRHLCELEVAPGIEDICRKELIELVGRGALSQFADQEGAIQFDLKRAPNVLLSLQTANSAYLVQQFEIPRPKALLGHQNLRMILDQIRTIRDAHPAHTFQTFYLSAAGSNTSVMQRIKAEIAAQTGLDNSEAEGDLLLRIRRRQNKWEVLIRLTPRPLATRDWRVIDMPGALTAPVAHAMARLARIQPHEDVLNLMCGSGSMMIEAMRASNPDGIIGLDIDPTALDAACANLQAARVKSAALLYADTCTLPFASESLDVLLADLPFGSLVGSHDQNITLYPKVMREAARIARPHARFILITHEVRLMDSVLNDLPQWHVHDVRKINLRGLHPRIYVLHKSP